MGEDLDVAGEGVGFIVEVLVSDGQRVERDERGIGWCSWIIGHLNLRAGADELLWSEPGEPVP